MRDEKLKTLLREPLVGHICTAAIAVFLYSLLPLASVILKPANVNFAEWAGAVGLVTAVFLPTILAAAVAIVIARPPIVAAVRIYILVIALVAATVVLCASASRAVVLSLAIAYPAVAVATIVAEWKHGSSAT